MPLISIIIPIYNAEKTLERCFESLQKQNYHDFEVLLIDDGSTDGTGFICHEIIKKDKRFRYYKQKNGGVSKARNLGLDVALGDWVTFVDADDWIESDMLDFLIKMSDNYDIVGMKLAFDKGITSHDAYMSCSSFDKQSFKSFPITILVPEASKHYDNVDVAIEITASVCGKMVKKSLIDKANIRFKDKLPLGEDGLFWLQCYLVATDFKFWNKVGYHYVLEATSSNFRYRSNIKEINLLYFDSYMLEYTNIPDRFKKEYITFLQYRMYCNQRNLFLFHKSNNMTMKERYAQLNEEISSFDIIIPKYLPVFKKIELFFLQKHLTLMLLCFGKLIITLKSLK